MNKSKNLIFFLLLLLLFSCSFDDKTGIWNEGKKEKRRIAELKEKQVELEDKVHRVFKPKLVKIKTVTPKLKKDGTLSKQGLTEEE